MSKKKPARAAYRKIAFSDAGKSATSAQLSEVQDLLALPKSSMDFIVWHNGGTPAAADFDWQTSRKSIRTSRIETLFGIDCRNPIGSSRRRLDIVWAAIKFYHWLSKWSVPLECTDDDWLLITFSTYDDERAGQIWLKEWQHDTPDDQTCRNKRIHYVAESCDAFAATWYTAPE